MYRFAAAWLKLKPTLSIEGRPVARPARSWTNESKSSRGQVTNKKNPWMYAKEPSPSRLAGQVKAFHGRTIPQTLLGQQVQLT